MEKATTLSMRVGRRPKRSAIQPKRRAPTGRMARVQKVASAGGGERDVKGGGDGAEAKGEEEVVEGVERPAEEAGEEGAALDGGERDGPGATLVCQLIGHLVNGLRGRRTLAGGGAEVSLREALREQGYEGRREGVTAGDVATEANAESPRE